ncbi:PREDICTED: uncharacterized protein LOC109165108 isoform X2 [Ipomoea nil]|uniref:uncharacterized protein LOC109165108 isoform X2 n=1 Tax=Ipomoea nil TaxID=35883 RepID=UPI000901F3FC|nr:PREDICTED: uncharacterized protein LOC109165108 isoform X2 [Ipomoea nil]
MGAEEGMESNPKTFVEEEEEDEDDDEGPPPGFDSIAIRSQLENMDVEDEDEDDDDDDGPPPGFAEPHQPETPPLSATSHSDTQRLRNQGLSDVEIGKKQNETKYEEDRPPLGSQSTSPKQPHQSMTSSELVSDTQMRSIEEDDDGPPPGWQWNPQQQPLPESIPPPGLQSAPSSSIQTGIIQEDDDGPPPGWQLISSQQRQPQTIPSLLPQSVAPSDIEMATKQQSIKNEEKKLRTDRGPSQRIISRLPPAALQISSEVGQLVCGTCRQLLSYPRGSKWVQCSACQTVNLALEGHQIGQVKCGGCTVLLMYPYGAPSVKCSSCHFVTRIGAHNRRPHLAAQQARRQRPSHQAH